MGYFSGEKYAWEQKNGWDTVNFLLSTSGGIEFEFEVSLLNLFLKLTQLKVQTSTTCSTILIKLNSMHIDLMLQ